MENTVIEILKKLRLYDDGTVMDSMTAKGMPYEKNRGVAIPELKRIADYYKPNQELAERLWQNSYRETKLLALMIVDADKMTLTVFETWLKNFNSSEYGEQACMNFLPYTEFAKQEMRKWTEAEATFTKQTGIILVARYEQLFPDLPDSTFDFFVENLSKYMEIENLHIQRAVARAINALSRKSPALNRAIKQILDNSENIENNAVRWILEEVNWNVDYNYELLTNI